MKKILIPSVWLMTFALCTGAMAMEAEYDYTNNVLTATVSAVPDSVVTSHITSADGTLIAVGQEKSDADGKYTYSFTFDEEKRGNYTLRIAAEGEISEKTVYYTGREGCDFLMFAVKGVHGKISDGKIVVTLPDSVNLKNVIPVFEVSEYATVSIDGKEQISGESEVNLNKKVTYTVTSGGGDVKEYEVYVKLKSSGSTGGGGGGRGGSASIPTPVPVLPEIPAENSAPEVIGKFKDVEISHWAYADILSLAESGIVAYAEYFEPERSITRAEFAKMATLALGMYNPDADCDFADASEAPWSKAYVGSAAESGLVNGIGNSMFGFNNEISRQDSALILCRALKLSGALPQFADNADISDYAVEYVGAMQSAGLITGDENGKFRPLDSISRAEAAALINRVRSVRK